MSLELKINVCCQFMLNTKQERSTQIVTFRRAWKLFGTIAIVCKELSRPWYNFFIWFWWSLPFLQGSKFANLFSVWIPPCNEWSARCSLCVQITLLAGRIMVILPSRYHLLVQTQKTPPSYKVISFSSNYTLDWNETDLIWMNCCSLCEFLLPSNGIARWQD